jgi:hypothetical protein
MFRIVIEAFREKMLVRMEKTIEKYGGSVGAERSVNEMANFRPSLLMVTSRARGKW